MSDTTPNPTPKAKHPHLEKVKKTFLELIAAVANEVNTLPDSEKPVEALRTLGASLDKLAARAEREAVLEAERQKPQAINPLVEITAMNLCRQVQAAARDLGANKALPKGYEDFQKAIKEAAETAKSAHRMLSQSGVAATVMMPGTPLTDETGKPLAETGGDD